MKRKLVIAAVLLAVALLSSRVMAQEELSAPPCVPCNAVEVGSLSSFNPIMLSQFGNAGFAQRGLSHQKLSLEEDIPAADRITSLFRSGTEPSVQFASLGCYYSFTGGTTCWNHTLYGWYCLTGSWYCQLLGSCRWIAIGSCK